MTMDPYSMSTAQWDTHIQTLLDGLTEQKDMEPLVAPDIRVTSTKKKQTTRERNVAKIANHPQYIATRQCKNERCKGADSDFIVDANGGCVVCILCGMIQDTAVLCDAPTYADSRGGSATSSVCAVHRYSRIAYLRGLLTSTDGETNVELTPKETRMIKHFITHHSDAYGGDYQMLVRQIKRSIHRMQLRPCLVYHAHTIAYMLFEKRQSAQNETEIRLALRRFRALELEWDRAPKDGPLRQGAKKFPSLPWMWTRICQDLNLSHDTTHLFYVTKTPKRCTLRREHQYTTLTDLALR